MARHFEPLQDRILVRVIPEQETVRGGIIIPDVGREQPQEGEVVAVGIGKLMDNGTRVLPGVAPGQRILYAKYSGAEVRIDGEAVLILREDEILGVLWGAPDTAPSSD